MENVTHVLITGNKVKYFLSAAEAQAVARIIQSNGKKIVIQGDIISLQVIPSMVEITRWYKQETERLYQQNKTMCRHCFAVTDSERCGCRDITDPSRILSAEKENYKPVSPEKIAEARRKIAEMRKQITPTV